MIIETRALHLGSCLIYVRWCGRFDTHTSHNLCRVICHTSHSNAASSRLSFCSVFPYFNVVQNLKCTIKHLVLPKYFEAIAGLSVFAWGGLVGAAALRSLDFKVGQFWVHFNEFFCLKWHPRLTFMWSLASTGFIYTLQQHAEIKSQGSRELWGVKSMQRFHVQKYFH